MTDFPTKPSRFYLYAPRNPEQELELSEAEAEMTKMIEQTARDRNQENFDQFHKAWRQTYAHLGANDTASQEAVFRVLKLERDISELYH